MFGLVAAILLFSRSYFAVSQEGLMQALASVADSKWGLPLTIVVFTSAAFIGTPQWLLIGASVFAFGPQIGGLYAWISTMCSASFDFWLAKYLGAARIEALSSDFLERLVNLIRRNGFLTSFAVRLVPTGPFVLVNMAVGVSGLRYAFFAAGTALGIIPKILVVALLGQGALTVTQGENFMLMAVFGAIVIVVLMLIARRLLQPHVNSSD